MILRVRDYRTIKLIFLEKEPSGIDIKFLTKVDGKVDAIPK
jgi:hypothetical protein